MLYARLCSHQNLLWLYLNTTGCQHHLCFLMSVFMMWVAQSPLGLVTSDGHKGRLWRFWKRVTSALSYFFLRISVQISWKCHNFRDWQCPIQTHNNEQVLIRESLHPPHSSPTEAVISPYLVKEDSPLVKLCWVLLIAFLQFTCLEIDSKRMWSMTSPGTKVRPTDLIAPKSFSNLKKKLQLNKKNYNPSLC